LVFALAAIQGATVSGQMNPSWKRIVRNCRPATRSSWRVLRQPFGFVAQLGVIALCGMIIRNSVILIDQIEPDIAAGAAPGNAVVEGRAALPADHLGRGGGSAGNDSVIALGVLGGAMAAAIMGGLIVAAALTLLFLPAPYAAWFRVRKTGRIGGWAAVPI
jgi:multidrug efflux pump